MSGAIQTADDAIVQLTIAIETGELREQHAPGGHAIFGAVDDAKEARTWLQENRNQIPTPLPPRVAADVQASIDGVYEASAGLLNDPDQPLPLTIWPQVQALPWPWIAAGVAGLLGVAILFQRRRPA